MIGLDVTLELGAAVEIDGPMKVELEALRDSVVVTVSVKRVPLPDKPLLLEILNEVPTALDAVNEELRVGSEVVAVSVTVKTVPIPGRLELLKLAVKFDGTVTVVTGKTVVTVVDDKVIIAVV